MDLQQFPQAAYRHHLLPLGQPPVWKEILVPTDFSACADNALRHALGLALASGAALHLLHSVYLPLPVPGVILNPIEQIQSEGKAELERMALAVQAWLAEQGLPSVEITCTVRVGFAAEDIVAVAKTRACDLVVLGTQGAGGAKGFFLGSNAAAVVRHAECPVMVIPNHTVWQGLSRIGYATDLEVIDTDVLEVLASLAQVFASEIEVMHITADASALPAAQIEAFEQTVRVHYQGAAISFSDYTIEDSNISAAIERISAAHAIDLMVLLRRDHGGFTGLLHRSLTKQLALHAQLPLLVCH